MFDPYSVEHGAVVSIDRLSEAQLADAMLKLARRGLTLKSIPDSDLKKVVKKKYA